jgi:hypothetical protein
MVAGLRGGEFIGPGALFGLRGHAKVVGSSRASRDPVAAAELWTLSERLTGVRFG